MQSDTTIKGELACLKFDLRCLEKGFVSCKPVLECPYDRIIEKDGKTYRIQVKTAGGKSKRSVGSVIASFRRQGRGRTKIYDRTDVEAIITYIPITGKFCWFGPEVFENRSTISIRISPPKNKQKKNLIMFETYKW